MSGPTAAGSAWYTRPDRLYDLAAYLLTVTVAIASSWKAAELVWALWITGLVGTAATIGAPWLLLTVRPGLDPAGTWSVERTDTRAELGRSLMILAIFWGCVVAGYVMAALWIVGFVPLPGYPTETTPTTPSLVEAFVVCVTTFWVIIALNVANQLGQVLRAIRAGESSPTNPFVTVGRVLVAVTLMIVLYAIGIDSVGVAVLLFLFYIPEDVFAERVLGME